jgi:CBS domain-containing protein
MYAWRDATSGLGTSSPHASPKIVWPTHNAKIKMSSNHESHGSSLYQLLSSTPLSTVLKTKSIQPRAAQMLFLAHNLTIGEGLHALSLYKVLSAPMVIGGDLEYNESSFIGWISLTDICRGLISDLNIKSHHGSMLSVMSHLEQDGPKYFDRMLITLTNSDDKELLYVTDVEGTSLLDSCLLMLAGGNEKGRVRHRMGIFSNNGEIISIVSQSDVVRFLAANEGMFWSVASQTLEELGLAKVNSKITTLLPSMLAIDAIGYLLDEHISGAPIVDDSGKPIAHFSFSDLRGITREHLGVLALPLGEFISLTSGTTFLGYSQSTPGSRPFFQGLRIQSSMSLPQSHLPSRFFSSCSQSTRSTKSQLSVLRERSSQSSASLT